MAPETLRIGRGFAGFGGGALTLMTASPALAQTYSANVLIGAMPLTIALGAGGFALIAMAVLRRMLKDSRAARARAPWPAPPWG